MAALDDVTVELQRGRFTAIMGPSGSGKSTLLHMLAGLDRPTSGEVYLGDTEITTPARQAADDAATGPDRLHLPVVQPAADHDCGREHRAAHAHRGPPPRPAWVASIVETVGLTRSARAPAVQLSGGQQQRVAAARALASRPEIVFADEPTGALDSRSGAELLRFLRTAVDELAQTVVMVTHDPTAAAYADRVLFLADGRIADEMHAPSAEAVLDYMKHLGA